jgi:N-acetylmuramoyl-L-alanine amidase
MHGNTVFVPLEELLRALSLAQKPDGGVVVLQPQLTSIDVRPAAGGTQLLARAGIPLRPRQIAQSPDRVVYEFDGVGTTLERTQNVSAPGVRAVEVAQSGSARDPITTMTVDVVAGNWQTATGTDDGRDFSLTLTQSGTVTSPVGQASPAAPGVAPQPAASAAAPSGGQVTAVNEVPGPEGYLIDVTVNGSTSYDWHRLRAPDNRFWLDLSGTQLAMPPRDDAGNDPVSGVRVRQIDPNTVRIALSLTGPKVIDVTATPTGLRILVHPEDGDDYSLARSGSGSVGAAVVAQQLPPGAEVTPAPSTEAWKFAPQQPAYVAPNPRLIVIDPGHGGSDPGSMRGGLREATLTLDMAERLRDILVARGWQVKLTRTGDDDVYGAFASAHAELQARDDVANKRGARMLISIHVNSYMNSGPNGTTSYYSKELDVPLARAVQRAVVAQAGTTDDGIVKSHLYVTLHANMPAVLIETAFLSNPDDFSRLSSADWRQKVAKAIADGIADYAGSPPAATSSQDTTDQ